MDGKNFVKMIHLCSDGTGNSITKFYENLFEETNKEISGSLSTLIQSGDYNV